MSNPLFNALGGGMPQGNGPMQMIQQFMQFKQNFKGDPKAEVEKMAKAYGMEADKLKEYMGDAEKKSMKNDLAIQKAVELVMDNVKERAKAKSKKAATTEEVATEE